MGPMHRATVSVTQFMIPDEILWRIAVYWPDKRAGGSIRLMTPGRHRACLT